MTWPEWKPMRALSDLEKDLDEAFSALIHEPWQNTLEKPRPPAVDIYESAGRYVIVVDLPGVVWKRLQVEADSHRVTVRGERVQVRQTRRANCISVERHCGRFARTLCLDESVEPESLQSELDNGVLIVQIDKKEMPPSTRTRSSKR